MLLNDSTKMLVHTRSPGMADEMISPAEKVAIIWSRNVLDLQQTGMELWQGQPACYGTSTDAAEHLAPFVS